MKWHALFAEGYKVWSGVMDDDAVKQNTKQYVLDGMYTNYYSKHYIMCFLPYHRHFNHQMQVSDDHHFVSKDVELLCLRTSSPNTLQSHSYHICMD